MDSTGTQNYVTDGSSPASPVLKDGNAIYTPGVSEHRGSTSKFYHGDALGSTRGITDSSQSVTNSQLFDAFGNTVSRTGTTPTPFGFDGKEQYQSDSDSGLQLLGHRYYDPSIGRFLSQDPIHDGTNWYAYADNNPLVETDATGLQPPKDGTKPPKEGKKPTPPPTVTDPTKQKYKTLSDAAKAILAYLMPISMANNVEYGGPIYQNSDGTYTPHPWHAGGPYGIHMPKDPNAKGDYHTHPVEGGPDSSDDGDQSTTDGHGYPGFTGIWNGSIWKNNPRPVKRWTPVNPHNPRTTDGPIKLPIRWNTN